MEDLNIVICGAAGQGIKTVEKLLSQMFGRTGHFVFSTKEYMSRVRGGSNSTDLRVSGRKVRCPVRRVDLLIALDGAAVGHMEKRIDGDTVVVADPDSFEDRKDLKATLVPVALKELAGEAGAEVYSNTVAAGVVAGGSKLDREACEEVVRTFFQKHGEEVVRGNLEAFGKGYGSGEELDLDRSITPGEVEGQLLLSGGTAVGLGALAGGLRFICSYPMSPSTAVLVFLAQNARKFGLVVEQAEDEISAVNMGLGAWYTGARSMVTTSGGGLALMSEGISLSGMVETPLVLHVAQRPGPATGLPTRTAQEDLELVLHAGHGEFPRIILAPGSLEEAFTLTARAFMLAEKHQVPVFILTDQHLMDSFYHVPELSTEDIGTDRFLAEAEEGYRRYTLEDDSPPPMAVPGSGKGLVCLDSDEHDQAGHITEDLDLRVKMVDRRLGKMRKITEDVLEPELTGEGPHLVICWGSTGNACLEAIDILDRDDVALLRVSQPYPLSGRVSEIMEEADTVITVEGNATGQFGRLLRDLTGVTPDGEILRYDGLPFRADTLAEDIASQLEGR
ncbi:MAG: 2-oxoacid:acceptor oxidoreductase subunit alpha [Candidatus Aegiribacteria sp.]